MTNSLAELRDSWLIIAIGIAMVGASAGGILIPPVVGGLIELYNWRVAVAALSLGIWLITLPLLVFALKKDSGKGFALGPWLMGRMHDSNGSYDQAFVLFAALSVVAGFCLLRVTPDHWRSRIRSGELESTEGVTFERQYYT